MHKSGTWKLTKLLLSKNHVLPRAPSSRSLGSWDRSQVPFCTKISPVLCRVLPYGHAICCCPIKPICFPATGCHATVRRATACVTLLSQAKQQNRTRNPAFALRSHARQGSSTSEFQIKNVHCAFLNVDYQLPRATASAQAPQKPKPPKVW
jgi:hypothetical protein